MQVTVYGPLRSATEAPTVELDVDQETVAAVLDAFVEAYPGTRSQLFTEAGELRPSVRVMVDGDRVDPETPCPDDAAIGLFPAMQGG